MQSFIIIVTFSIRGKEYKKNHDMTLLKDCTFKLVLVTIATEILIFSAIHVLMPVWCRPRPV